MKKGWGMARLKNQNLELQNIDTHDIFSPKLSIYFLPLVLENSVEANLRKNCQLAKQNCLIKYLLRN